MNDKFFRMIERVAARSLRSHHRQLIIQRGRLDPVVETEPPWWKHFDPAEEFIFATAAASIRALRTLSAVRVNCSHRVTPHTGCKG